MILYLVWIDIMHECDKRRINTHKAMWDASSLRVASLRVKMTLFDLFVTVARVFTSMSSLHTDTECSDEKR